LELFIRAAELLQDTLAGIFAVIRFRRLRQEINIIAADNFCPV